MDERSIGTTPSTPIPTSTSLMATPVSHRMINEPTLDPSHPTPNPELGNTPLPTTRTTPEYVVTSQTEGRDQNSDIEEKQMDEKHRRKKVLSYLCCICCPCFPMWTRCICCFLLVVIIVLAIVAGVLVALFQMPTVTFNGPTDDPNGLPRFQSLSGNESLGAFNINLGLNFTVVNPNVEGLTFEKIRAIAYYPIQPDIPLGGGNMSNLRINSASTTRFVFPFQMHYDPLVDPGFSILFDLMTKCGLLGSSRKEDIRVNYDLRPTIRVVGIPITFTIHQSTTFACPIQSGGLLMANRLLSFML